MNRYQKRILRVIDYIHDNPAGDLSLDTLAEVAAMSRFHWHRLYRAMTGETCAQAVRRLRMHRAAALLVQSELPVAEVGKRVGYPDLASFTRTFSALYSAPPATFRKAGRVPLSPTNFLRGDPTMHIVDIRDARPRRLAALPHTGPYPEIARAFQSVYAVIGSHGLFPHIREGVAIYHDDVTAVPEAERRSHAGVTMAHGVEVPEGLEAYNLPGGRLAVLTYKGPYTGLPAVYDFLYGTWLPASNEEPSAHPSYEVYLNDPTDTAPDNLVTEVCVPLQSVG
ncbi:MAG: AraC family transcriptional regulator [Pseudomonadota bacterium]